jgi:hypothetical protein
MPDSSGDSKKWDAMIVFGTSRISGGNVQYGRRCHQFLFAGEKRVTFRANFHTDIRLCGSDLQDISTGAGNLCLFVFRVNAFFHVLLLKINAYYEFIDSRNSALSFVFLIFSSKN